MAAVRNFPVLIWRTNSLVVRWQTTLSNNHKRRDRRSRTSGRERQRLKPLPFVPLTKYPKTKPHEFNQDIDWSSVYQSARPFDPYLIPLPIRMGRPGPGEVPPPAIGNTELLKIPNFFHLTPPAIQKHCDALRALCTPWPTHLPSLPLRIVTRNYIFASHNIRHEGARVVRLSFCLKDLSLTPQCRQKMIKLAGWRYNSKKDEITLTGKQCPTRKQNREYVMYLMKVLYLESNKIESWEREREKTSN